jgi:D-glycero-D-manno-heptose 1,7-bisphosphate phosphatase
VQPPEHEYVSNVSDLELLPGAIEGIAALGNCGFALLLASNQRGVGRGLVSEQTLEQIDRELQRALEPHGVQFAEFLYCPHLIEDDCDCRKPKPGLLIRAAAELELDL